MNALNEELEGKVVLIRKSDLNEEWHEDHKRAFLCRGGFGCSPHTMGEALIGTFLIDGEKCRMEGRHVDATAGVVADSLDAYDGPIHQSVTE